MKSIAVLIIIGLIVGFIAIFGFLAWIIVYVVNTTSKKRAQKIRLQQEQNWYLQQMYNQQQNIYNNNYNNNQ